MDNNNNNNNRGLVTVIVNRIYRPIIVRESG